jgi:hypothetical protein
LISGGGRRHPSLPPTLYCFPFPPVADAAAGRAARTTTSATRRRDVAGAMLGTTGKQRQITRTMNATVLYKTTARVGVVAGSSGLRWGGAGGFIEPAVDGNGRGGACRQFISIRNRRRSRSGGQNVGDLPLLDSRHDAALAVAPEFEPLRNNLATVWGRCRYEKAHETFLLRNQMLNLNRAHQAQQVAIA